MAGKTAALVRMTVIGVGKPGCTRCLLTQHWVNLSVLAAERNTNKQMKSQAPRSGFVVVVIGVVSRFDYNLVVAWENVRPFIPVCTIFMWRLACAH